MPSSNKTTHFQLNKWLGSDKPKKDDFNADNEKTDTALAQLNQTLTALSSTVGGNRQALEQSIGQVDGRCTTLNSALTSHTGNTTAHVTAAERTAWNGKDQLVVGTYTGNGTTSREVTLSVSPRMGFLFAAGKGIAEASWAGQELNVYSGFFGTGGCSKQISLQGSKLTLTHNTTSPASGQAYRYNETGVTYVWVAWK